MARFKLSILFVVFTLFTACANPTAPSSTDEVVGKQVSVGEGTYTDISVAELQMMLANKDFTFVNVHIPFEGDIARTDLSIPYDQITENLDKLPDKNTKLVLYCRSGRMSAIAAETLVGAGYSSVWNLSGGMVEWEQAGLEIIR